jgi:hypothetical protein
MICWFFALHSRRWAIKLYGGTEKRKGATDRQTDSIRMAKKRVVITFYFLHSNHTLSTEAERMNREKHVCVKVACGVMCSTFTSLWGGGRCASNTLIHGITRSATVGGDTQRASCCGTCSSRQAAPSPSLCFSVPNNKNVMPTASFHRQPCGGGGGAVLKACGASYGCCVMNTTRASCVMKRKLKGHKEEDRHNRHIKK